MKRYVFVILLIGIILAMVGPASANDQLYYYQVYWCTSEQPDQERVAFLGTEAMGVVRNTWTGLSWTEMVGTNAVHPLGLNQYVEIQVRWPEYPIPAGRVTTGGFVAPENNLLSSLITLATSC